MAEYVVIPRTQSVSLRYFQASSPVQVFIRILQFQKYCIQDLLPYSHYLMEQFVLKGGGPSAATCPETTEDVVEVNGDGEAETDNDRHQLPHHLCQANSMVFSSPLGN